MKYEPTVMQLRLGDVLVAMGRLSRMDLRAALAIQRKHPQGCKLGNLLTRVGLAAKRDVDHALRMQRRLRHQAGRERVRAVFPSGGPGFLAAGERRRTVFPVGASYMELVRRRVRAVFRTH